MRPRLDISGPERANAARIGITIGAIVIGLIVLIWGGSALLGLLLDKPALAPVAPGSSTPTVSPRPIIAEEPAEPETPTVEPSAAVGVPVAPQAPAPAPTSAGVVVIDAGHQGKGSSALEPIGPGATEKKPRVTSGTAGVATRNPESEITLQVALKLRDELQARGIKVVMVRTSQNVDISNSERAKIGNDAKADLVIRLHCDGATDRSRTGLSTLVPGRNQWTGPIVAESARAASFVHRSVVSASGAKDRGIVERTDLSGFNWSTRPSVLVEMGFMSNAEEDRKLATPDYQGKLVRGMAEGIGEYLRSR